MMGKGGGGVNRKKICRVEGDRQMDEKGEVKEECKMERFWMGGEGGQVKVQIGEIGMIDGL